jgi:hypothetical protein
VTPKELNWIVVIFGIAGPFVVWGVLYVAVRRMPSHLRLLMKRLRVLRWITWCLAIAFWLFTFVSASQLIRWSFGSAFLTFSIGLSFPQNWLKGKAGSPSPAIINASPDLK